MEATDIGTGGWALAARPAAGRTATMQAVVPTAPETPEVREVPRPEPAPGEVRVRLQGCGVCASNLPPWEGRPWFDYPQAPGAGGHEGWGRVDALGAEVTHLEAGDRVAVLSHHAYAEYDTAPAAHVVRLPPALDGRPFPGEPLGCAMNVFRRSAIRPGQTVAVVGVGFLGALLVRLARQASARVFATSRRASALEIAEQFGADETMRAADHEAVIEQVMDGTDGDGCDCVIEATGKQGPLDLASRLVRVRGRLVIAGYHQDGRRTVDMQQWNWRGIDVINAHERDPRQYVRGMREAVAVAASGGLDPAPLYTHSLGLNEIDDAFRLLQERPAGFMKAMIVM